MQIIMPKLGLTMTHGTITEWLKAPGDAVKAEEALCAYETEKVTLELAAPEDGVLAEILAPAGTAVPAGAAVCEFVTKDEGRRTKDGGQGTGIRSQAAGDRGQETGDRGQAPAESVQPPASNLQPLTATPKARALARQAGVDLANVAGSGPAGRIQAADVLAVGAGSPRPATAPAEIKATPLARRIAASEGVDLATLTGTGTGAEGTITREDVEQAVRRQGTGDRDQESGVRDQASGDRGQESAAAPVSQAVQLPATSFQQPASGFRPHSALRRTIAERMSQSAFNAPHVTLMTEAEATNLVSARAQLNAEVPAADKISYNTLLAALTARALREHPNVNARWEADGIRLLAEYQHRAGRRYRARADDAGAARGGQAEPQRSAARLFGAGGPCAGRQVAAR